MQLYRLHTREEDGLRVWLKPGWGLVCVRFYADYLFVSLAQTRVTLKEATSMEELPPSDWAYLWGIFLIAN